MVRDYGEKKIAFVTHEFGLVRNGGGIASYLYSYAKKLLAYTSDIQLYVLTCHFHEKCELVEEERFHVYRLKGTVLSALGKEVRDILRKIEPDYVETTDYLGLSLESMIYKNTTGGCLAHTVFMLYTHTASREIYEWGQYGDIAEAPRRFQVPFGREWAQMVLADVVISPSHFLQEYVWEHYNIAKPEYVPYVFDYEQQDRQKLIQEMNRLYDLEGIRDKFVVTYLSRFERRKNQQLLVNVFLRFLQEVNEEAVLLLIGNGLETPDKKKNLMLEVYRTIPEEYKSNIRFFEFAVEEEKKKFFSISDLAVMASTYENFPFAMIETVCCGVPIMTSVHCGCCDYMGSYREQTSFDPFSEEDVFEKLTVFYRLESEEREKIAEEQSRNLRELCQVKHSLIRKLDLFEEVRQNDFRQKRRLVTMSYSSRDAAEETKEPYDLLVFPDGYSKKRQEMLKRKLDGVLGLIQRHPGQFAISLGKDCLQTTAGEAWRAGYPILFTNVISTKENSDVDFDRLMEQRKASYFSIPLG